MRLASSFPTVDLPDPIYPINTTNHSDVFLIFIHTKGDNTKKQKNIEKKRL